MNWRLYTSARLFPPDGHRLVHPLGREGGRVVPHRLGHQPPEAHEVLPARPLVHQVVHRPLGDRGEAQLSRIPTVLKIQVPSLLL